MFDETSGFRVAGDGGLSVARTTCGIGSGQEGQRQREDRSTRSSATRGKARSQLHPPRRDHLRSLALAARSVLPHRRSEEHTSELQSLMRISYADFCLNKKKTNTTA